MTEENTKNKHIVKHEKNPFLRMTEIKSRGSQVRFSQDNGDQVVLNRETGEMAAAHVISYREVDNEEFVKLFTANIALTFNLSQAGRKVFDLLLRVLQKTAIGKDQVYLSDEVRQDALAEFPKLKMGKSTFYNGVKDLIENQIIAKSTKTNVFYINPHLIFNGDRIAFTHAIKRKNRKSVENGTADLFVPSSEDDSPI